MRIARADTALSSDAIAMPSIRLTMAVATF
jgi:hypothetical protein